METCGWSPVKNGTDRPETQETHADNEAWENYSTTPHRQATTGGMAVPPLPRVMLNMKSLLFFFVVVCFVLFFS